METQVVPHAALHVARVAEVLAEVLVEVAVVVAGEINVYTNKINGKNFHYRARLPITRRFSNIRRIVLFCF